MPKKQGKKPSLKVKDLSAKKDPKGGAFNAYLKFEEPTTTTTTTTTTKK